MKNNIYSLRFINKELRESQNNINNRLLYNFTEIKIDKYIDKNSIEDEQNLVFRNEFDEKFIYFGNCGTPHV